MKQENIKQLLQNEEIANNTHLKLELQKLIYYPHSNEIVWIPLSFETYLYLINNGLSPELAISQAIQFSQSDEVVDKLFNLSLAHNLDPNKLSEKTLVHLSENNLKLLLAHGLKAQQFLQHALNFDIKKYNSEMGQFVIDPEAKLKQYKLIKLSYEHGAQFSAIESISICLSLESLNFLITYGLKPEIALQTALNGYHPYYMTAEEYTSTKQVISMALENQIDYRYISWPSDISEADIKLLFNNGLKAQDFLLEYVLRIHAVKYSFDTELYTFDQADQEKQYNLIRLAVEYGAEIKSIQTMPFTLSIDSINFLIEQGLKTNIILKAIPKHYKPFVMSDEEFISQIEQLVFVALEYGADANIINNLPVFPSNTLIETLLTHGLPDNALKIVLNGKIGEYDYIDPSLRYNIDSKKVDLQHQLIEKTLERGANFNNIINDIEPVSELFAHHNELITKHLDANYILIGASRLSSYVPFSNEDKDVRDYKKLAQKLIKLTLDNGANINININGNTALDIVGDPEIIYLLKSHGAKCSYTDIDEIYAGNLDEFFLIQL